MIKELSNPEEYDPLLDYAQNLFDQIHPDIDPCTGDLFISQVPYLFQMRYAGGQIDVSRKNKYLESEELQDSLRAFGIDKDMFWYLCLCIKDYVEGFTIEAPTTDSTPIEDIKKMNALLESMDLNFLHGWYNVQASKQASLKLKVEGCKKGVEISNPVVFMALKEAIKDFLDKYGNNPALNSSHVLFDKPHTHAAIHQLYYFNEYLSTFLKPLKAIKSVHASKDKQLMVSRMIFILGISDNEDFYEEYNDNGKKNYLKGMLRHYKPSTRNTVNKYYF